MSESIAAAKAALERDGFLVMSLAGLPGPGPDLLAIDESMQVYCVHVTREGWTFARYKHEELKCPTR